MTLFYFFIFSIILLLSLSFFFQTRRFKNLPPGPFSFPIIGNLYQFKQPICRTFQAIANKHGPIISLWLGSRFVVVVSSQEAVQECFTKNDIVLANRPIFLNEKYTGYNNTTIAAAPYGDHWRNLRRIMSLEILSTHRINTFFEIRRDELMRLVKNLAHQSHNGFAKVELTSKFSEMTFNTMMRMVSGKRYYGEDCDVSDVEEAKQFREIIKELMEVGGVSNVSDFLPLLKWFDFDGLEKKLKRISKRSDAFLQGLIDEHRNGEHFADTMIGHLLTQQKLQPEYYTDQIIKGLALVMLLAGTDTSAIILEWAMASLLNHPEIMKKAKSEIENYIGQKNRLVDESDIHNLHYLQSIIYETLRLHPAAPMLVPHFSSEDCTIGGYHIPKNTILLVNAWSIHTDPKLWSDPTQFKPERFENENESSKLIPFGLGRRACPGANLAHRTLSSTLAALIHTFEWKRISKEEIDMSDGKGLTMQKKFPLEAMCKVCQSPIIKNI